MRSIFPAEENPPELLPLNAADCAWLNPKEKEKASRVEAERLAVFNQSADSSTYRRRNSVRRPWTTSTCHAMHQLPGWN
jgi:hypothetical protein